MQKFHRILFVSQGLTDDLEALKQALGIARNDGAALHALIACPAFPKELTQYREKYDTWLARELEASLRLAREATGVDESELPVGVEVVHGSHPSVSIVRHVLRHAHDLVVKVADRKQGEAGFRALDMELLRKCPCPVWLDRPIGKPRGEIRVAVAIDPENTEPEGRDLSRRLLRMARALADTRSGGLDIVSCWDYPFEEYLRNSPWVRIPEDDLRKNVMVMRARHRAALDDIIAASGIGGAVQVHHVRGLPDELIPRFVADARVDILVMGTVARTGIPGFLIGNTAENVVQKLGCTLLALKPAGFVSPTSPY